MLPLVIFWYKKSNFISANLNPSLIYDPRPVPSVSDPYSLFLSHIILSSHPICRLPIGYCQIRFPTKNPCAFALTRIITTCKFIIDYKFHRLISVQIKKIFSCSTILNFLNFSLWIWQTECPGTIFTHTHTHTHTYTQLSINQILCMVAHEGHSYISNSLIAQV